MKKFPIFLITVLLIALFAGCSKTDSSNTGVGSQSFKDESSGNASVSKEQSNGLTGKYVADLKEISPEYMPYIELFSDGTFLMQVNLLEGMGLVEGIWSEDGENLSMQVKKRDFSGFLGDDVDKFGFKLKDKNTIEYSGGSIGVTDDGNLFFRK